MHGENNGERREARAKSKVVRHYALGIRYYLIITWEVIHLNCFKNSSVGWIVDTWIAVYYVLRFSSMS
jgi:hypothetical protein